VFKSSPRNPLNQQLTLIHQAHPFIEVAPELRLAAEFSFLKHLALLFDLAFKQSTQDGLGRKRVRAHTTFSAVYRM
jgi:hypothetical protein